MKTLVMEFAFFEVGDCNFTIKELHQRFFTVSFDISLWELTTILKAIAVLSQLHFDSYSAEAVMIGLTKHLNTLSSQSFRGVFGKLFGEKKLELCQKNVSGGSLF